MHTSLWAKEMEAVYGLAKPKYCVILYFHLLSGLAHPCSAAGLSSDFGHIL